VAEIMVERENEERERRQKREKLGRKADFVFPILNMIFIMLRP